MADRRVLANHPATITVALLDQDGAPKDAAGSLAATATRLDGTSVALANPTDAGDGNVTVSLLRTDLPLPDLLTITVTDSGDDSTTTTTLEVVGGFFFSLNEARAADPSLQRLDRYPNEDVIRVRQEVEDECERICGQAFVPRAARLTLSGDGSHELFLDRPIRSVRSASVNGTALTTDELAGVVVDDVGLVSRRTGTFGYGIQNVSLIVEYGWNAPPSDLKAASVWRLRERLNSTTSTIPSRAISQIAEGNSWTLATPGRGGFETGNPEVDAVYARYRWAPVLA